MLENLKKTVLTYSLEAERTGLCKHKAGNFSARDKETGYICITPTGADREQMTLHDIVVMDGTRVIEATTNLRPTTEALMHIAAYDARPDIMAVAHTHSRFATVFSILKKPIPAVVYELLNLGCKEGYIPVAPYARPGTKELADSIKEPLKISDSLLMQSHGTLAVAGDLKGALLKAAYMEEIAEIYYRTLLLTGGKEPPTIPLDELCKWSYPKDITLLDKQR
jgi:L-fuculose-phosphate aldolase